MAVELAPVDIGTMPDLVRLVEEVRAAGRPRRLRRAGEDVALLVPAPSVPKRRAKGMSEHTNGDSDSSPKGNVRQRRDRLSITERTAGALKRYAKDPPATREQEKEAFAQAIAEEVAGRAGA